MNSITSFPFDRLPEDLQGHAASFLRHGTLDAASKTARSVAKSAKLTYDYYEIKASQEGTLLHQLWKREVRTDAPEQKIALVNQVRKAATLRIRSKRHLLFPQDCERMGLNPEAPVSDFSYENMNYAWDQIQKNSKDLALLRAFHQIRKKYPNINTSIGSCPENMGLHAQASRIRAWLARKNEPAIRDLLAEVTELNTEKLPGIAPELVEFPNLAMGPLLLAAVEKNQPEAVEKILQALHLRLQQQNLPNEERDELLGYINAALINARTLAALLNAPIHYMSSVLCAFARSRLPLGNLSTLLEVAANQNDVDLAQTILKSIHSIDEWCLGSALMEAVRAKRSEMVKTLLQGERALPAYSLYLSLNLALEGPSIDIVQLFVENSDLIDPIHLGMALEKAVETNQLELVQAILQSDREIAPGRLGATLEKAVETKQLELVQAILQSHRVIDSYYLGTALEKAVETNQLELAQAILQSHHLIPPFYLTTIVRKAIQAGSVEKVRLILQSDRELDPDRLEAAFINNLDQRIHQLLIQSGKIDLLTRLGKPYMNLIQRTVVSPLNSLKLRLAEMIFRPILTF